MPRFAAIWVATALLFAVSTAAGAGQRQPQRTPLDAAVRRDPRDRVDRSDARDPAARPRPLRAGNDHARDDHRHEESRTASTRSCPRRSGLIVVACLASGLLSGFAITRLGITPLVATLGVNALLTGVVLQVTSGAATASATPGLARFALAKTAGIPNTVIIAFVAIVVLAVLMRTTVVGRRFVSVGTSPAAAHAAGIRVKGYQVATYVVASLSYGAAGILVAGFLGTPGIGAGNDYLLPTIAAVVLGGTSLAGGRGSVAAIGRRRRLPHAARAGRARHGRAELGPARHPGLDHRARHGTALSAHVAHRDGRELVARVERAVTTRFVHVLHSTSSVSMTPHRSRSTTSSNCRPGSIEEEQ